MMKSLAIIGASGHGKVVAEIAELTGWDNVCFFDDAYPSLKSVGVWKVCGKSSDLFAEPARYTAGIVAIGDNGIRLEKTKKMQSQRMELATLIHPASTVSQYANIEEGSVVMAGAVINPFVTVGRASIVNTSCSIDHDCFIGEAVHISPGVNVAGGVSIGRLSWLGIGATVKQGVDIGCSVMVGAGAVVVNDIPRDCVVKGVPAKQEGH